MAEILADFADVLVADNGARYHAHACGAPRPDGTWQGWLEFIPVDEGEPIRSGRETTQPNRTDAVYWATGLTRVYLEGALDRTLRPLTVRQAAVDTPVFDEPATLHKVITTVAGDEPEPILDPFAVYAKEGEAPLRDRLAALSAWHLVNIIAGYDLSGESVATLSRLPAAALIDRIVVSVRPKRTRAARRAS